MRRQDFGQGPKLTINVDQLIGSIAESVLTGIATAIATKIVLG